ncbi:MAG: hypothetical protein ACF8R7_11795 [Phycisphaerales bacterium JB039]
MSRMMPQGYEIARPTGLCAATGRPIAVGESFVAALVEPTEPDAAAALVRADYSLGAWEQGRRPERLFACWRARMPEPREKKRALVEDEELAQLFDQLGEPGEADDGGRRARFRYVLAWLLVRRKLMQYGGSAGGVMRLRRSGSLAAGPQRDEPWLEVPDPGLSDDELAAATRDLAVALFGEDEDAGPEEPAP